jgi:hypothetical protein
MADFPELPGGQPGPEHPANLGGLIEQIADVAREAAGVDFNTVAPSVVMRVGALTSELIFDTAARSGVVVTAPSVEIMEEVLLPSIVPVFHKDSPLSDLIYAAAWAARAEVAIEIESSVPLSEAVDDPALRAGSISVTLLELINPRRGVSGVSGAELLRTYHLRRMEEAELKRQKQAAK